MVDICELGPEGGENFRRGGVRRVRPGVPQGGEELPPDIEQQLFDRRPMLAFAVALACGDLCASAPWAGGVVILGVVTLTSLGGSRWRGVLLVPLLCALVLSFARGVAALDSTNVAVPARVTDLDPRAAGRLQPEIGIWEDGSGPSISGMARWRLSLPQPLDSNGVADWDLPPPKLANPGEAVALLPGDGPLLRAEGPVPGSWAKHGVLGSVRVMPDSLQRLAPAPRSPLQYLLGNLDLGRPRKALIARANTLDAGLPRGLLAALLFGSKTGVDPAAKDLFTRTGTRHLLAISGLHVGLISVFLILPIARGLSFFLSRLLGANRNRNGLSAPIGIVLVLIFVPLAGAAPPVLRACAALILALAAPHFGPLGRRPDSLNLWGFALVIENLARPAAMTDLSVRLSYMATLGLILTLGALASRLPGARTPVQLRIGTPSWSRLIWSRLLRTLRFALAASLAAVWITLPETWSTFGEVAPIGILITPLAVPLIAWILTLAWSILLLAPVLNALFSELAEHLIDLLVAPAGEALGRLLAFADNLPGTPVVLPPRPGVAIALAVGFGILALIRRRRWAKSGTLRNACPLALAASVLGAALLLPWSAAPASAEVVIANVGHGTAGLVRLPSGAIWIFDGGSRDRLRTATEALLPQLAKWEGPRPHYILSHNDMDHRSALPRLIEKHPPRSWTGHLPPEIAARLPSDCAIRDTGMGRLNLASEPSARLYLVRGSEVHGNEGSRTLVLETERWHFLLWGDAEQEGLAGILPLLPQRTSMGMQTILLLPHHGSETALLGRLLQQTLPIQIWVSGSSRAQLAPEIERLGFALRATYKEGPLSWSSLENPCNPPLELP